MQEDGQAPPPPRGTNPNRNSGPDPNQEDVLPGTSTVEEHLLFHAAVRAPALSGNARRVLVERVLAALQLSSKAGCAIGDGFVRGLSGGERRRVSVSVELLVLAARGAEGGRA